jgi:hypothetical protein
MSILTRVAKYLRPKPVPKPSLASRRGFLKVTVATAGAIAIGGAAGCGKVPEVTLSASDKKQVVLNGADQNAIMSQFGRNACDMHRVGQSGFNVKTQAWFRAAAKQIVAKLKNTSPQNNIRTAMAGLTEQQLTTLSQLIYNKLTNNGRALPNPKTDGIDTQSQGNEAYQAVCKQKARVRKNAEFPPYVAARLSLNDVIKLIKQAKSSAPGQSAAAPQQNCASNRFCGIEIKSNAYINAGSSQIVLFNGPAIPRNATVKIGTTNTVGNITVNNITHRNQIRAKISVPGSTLQTIYTICINIKVNGQDQVHTAVIGVKPKVAAAPKKVKRRSAPRKAPRKSSMKSGGYKPPVKL